MVLSLANRLKAARHTYFVGREAELELFQAALAAPELPFNVLLIFGPGGIGKTSLLYEFAYLCEQARIPATYLDARRLEATPEGFENALRRHMALNRTGSIAETLAAQARSHVLLIDTYESLTPLDTWLRQTFLPQLPATVLTVLAGRQKLLLGWLADPGWQTLLRTLSLSNLSTEESQIYLTRRKIPTDQQPAILDFTHGHPLALSLAVDIFAQRPAASPNLYFETSQSVVTMLLKQLVQKVPGPAYRAALEVCALVRVTTEALLAEMLRMPDVHELFEWLQQLSWIEIGRAGLFPHDLVREALTADLRWRNRDWYAELHHRARTFYANHLHQTTGPAQQRLILDYIFLHRDNPTVRPFFEWQTSGGALPDGLRQGDIPALTAMVAKHEGQDSARLAAFWFARQPENILVMRNPEQQPIGFLAQVALHQTTPDDRQTDPASQASWRYLQTHSPLRPGEKATLFRFWLADETYQAVSPTQSLIFVNIARHYLTTPGLAFTFFPCADPEFWAPMCTYADLTRIREADFEVGGRGYGVYGHDWRLSPPETWLEQLAEREVAEALQTPIPPNLPSVAGGGIQPSPPVLILSQPDFEQAVREALRDLRTTASIGLRESPLLRSRLVVQRAGPQASEAERAAMLHTLLKEAADALKVSPREAKCYRALYHTYFQPAPTQEQAAELLDIPFSTFRRHLKTGVDRVTQILWQQEKSISYPRGHLREK